MIDNLARKLSANFEYSSWNTWIGGKTACCERDVMGAGYAAGVVSNATGGTEEPGSSTSSRSCVIGALVDEEGASNLLDVRHTVSYHADRLAHSSEQNLVEAAVSNTLFARRLMRYCCHTSDQYEMMYERGKATYHRLLGIIGPPGLIAAGRVSVTM